MTTPQPELPNECRRIYYYANFAAQNLAGILADVQCLGIAINAYKLEEDPECASEMGILAGSILSRVASTRVELAKISGIVGALKGWAHQLEESTDNDQ